MDRYLLGWTHGWTVDGKESGRQVAMEMEESSRSAEKEHCTISPIKFMV